MSGPEGEFYMLLVTADGTDSVDSGPQTWDECLDELVTICDEHDDWFYSSPIDGHGLIYTSEDGVIFPEYRYEIRPEPSPEESPTPEGDQP